MEKLKLNELLRYAFSGAITLFTFNLIFSGVFETFKKVFVNPSFINFSIIASLTLVLGSLIYTIHRAFLYPIFYRIVILIAHKGEIERCCNKCKLIFLPWIYHEFEKKLDIERWQRKQKEKSLQTNFDEWASQIHFMYTTVWGIASPFIIGGITKLKYSTLYLNTKTIIPLIIFVLLLLIFCIKSHLRYIRYEKEVSDIEKEIETPKKESTTNFDITIHHANDAT